MQLHLKRNDTTNTAGTDRTAQAINKLQRKLEDILEELAVSIAADIATVFLYDAKTNEFDLPIGYGLWDPATFESPRMWPRADRVAGNIIRERHPVIANDIAQHPPMNGAMSHRERIISAAGLPLISADQSVGVLFVGYRRAHTFTDADEQVMAAAARQAAAIIMQADVFGTLRQNRAASQYGDGHTMQIIADIACDVINLPTAIWILDPGSQSLRIEAMTGLPQSYFTQASANIGDGSVISRVIQTGEPQVLYDIFNDNRFRYPKEAQAAGWVSMFAFPINARGQTRGVIEAFAYELQDWGRVEFEIRRLAELVSVVLENTYRSRESQELSQLAHALSATPDFEQAMRVIAESARELTGADSSIIFLLEKRTNTFIIGSHAAVQEKSSIRLPRSTEGLTHQIIETGKAITIDDITEDQRVREAVGEEGVRSLIGVRIQMEDERIGVLYVHGQRKAHFTEYDVKLLQTLANQASVALGWERLLLKPSNKIEQASSNLLHLETVLDTICHEIQSELGFEFAAIQLIRYEEDIIETVHGTGIAAQWSGRVKHYLEQNPDFSDIQADIVRTKHIEIISGWDKRFDRWVYDTYHHDQLVRVIVPIIVVRDERGNVVDDWFRYCQWNIFSEEELKPGRRTVLEMHLPDLEGGKLITKVIGTVETGYQSPQKRLEIDQAIALATLIARRAPDIRQARLHYVLETIVECAMQIARADSASLHFLYDSRQNHYVYEVCTGDIGRHFPEAYSPHHEALGRQAIQAKEPKFIPDPAQGHDDLELERLNPRVFAEGIKAMAAFPLIVDQNEGILYIHFRREHRFTEDEIGWVQHFARRAVDAIRQATFYSQMRDRARELAALHSVAQSLVNMPEESELLWHIAANTLNILAADVVTIYEYIETEQRFRMPPDTVGRLKAEPNIEAEVERHDAPALLVEHGCNVYAYRSVDNPILTPKHPANKDEPFVIRESIKSSAGILLRVGKEIVGVMFVHYRHPHYFSAEETKIVNTLASSAAIAIKNRRLLEVLSTGEREIITTLDLQELLNLIVKRAVSITGASLGDIRRLDPISQTLVVKACYPTDIPVDLTWSQLPMGKGITGWAAKQRQTILVNDVANDQHYIPYFPHVRAELCVPLLDGDRRLLGTLNVESDRIRAFDRKDKRMLEALANHAVIAIQNAENQKRLTANGALATLGGIASSFIHSMRNDVGAIRTRAQQIQDAEEVDAHSKRRAHSIEVLADKIVEEANRIKRWTLDTQQQLNICRAVDAAVKRVRIPQNIITNIDLSNNLPQVLGGEQQLIEVFVNLIQNAVDAMVDGGGQLTVDGEDVPLEGKHWIRISVRDTGVGIPEEEKGKIFQPHDSIKEKGLGFGLYWTRTYIELLGGSITVQSQPKIATEFTLALPAWEQA